MSDRPAQIYLDHSKTESLPMSCGLPQGSLIFPILFPLYVEPLVRLLWGRFGYADNVAIFAAGKILEECISKLQLQLNHKLEWGKENRIYFYSL